MKAHIGADDQSGLVHTVISTAANVSDISQTAALLHGQEQRVGADAGYVGVEKRAEVQDKLKTMAQAVTFRIAKRRKPINDAQLNVLFALSNLYMIQRKTVPLRGRRRWTSKELGKTRPIEQKILY